MNLLAIVITKKPQKLRIEGNKYFKMDSLQY